MHKGEFFIANICILFSDYTITLNLSNTSKPKDRMKSRIISALFSLLIVPLLSSAQTPSCGDLKNGVFVSFSSADGSLSTYTRNCLLYTSDAADEEDSVD